jgi:hypothetical protein
MTAAERLLSADDLLEEVVNLEPTWSGRWSLEHYLRVFDESGDLRPSLPNRFAPKIRLLPWQPRSLGYR